MSSTGPSGTSSRGCCRGPVGQAARAQQRLSLLITQIRSGSDHKYFVKAAGDEEARMSAMPPNVHRDGGWRRREFLGAAGLGSVPGMAGSAGTTLLLPAQAV